MSLSDPKSSTRTQKLRHWAEASARHSSSKLSYASSLSCDLALSRHIFAIATFDSNGILERSEFRADRRASNWTEAIFSAIGFKGLLDATLNHQAFRYAKISGDSHVAFLVWRRRRYVALLSEPLTSWQEEDAIRTCLRELGTGDLLALMHSGVGQRDPVV